MLITDNRDLHYITAYSLEKIPSVQRFEILDYHEHEGGSYLARKTRNLIYVNVFSDFVPARVKKRLMILLFHLRLLLIRANRAEKNVRFVFDS